MGANIVRLLFFVFNLFVWLFGISVIVLGATSLKVVGLFIISNIVLGVGLLIALLGFLGCCGAIKRKRVLLTGYFLLVFLLFSGEIALGVYVYMYHGEVGNALITGSKHAITNKYAKGDKMSLFITVAIDLVQMEIHCCGVKGPHDYYHSYWQNASSSRHVLVPTSCCFQRVTGCNVITTTNITSGNTTIMERSHVKNNTNTYTTGCLQQGTSWLKTSFWDLIKVGIVIVVVEVVGILCALCLCCAFRKKNVGKGIS